MVLTDLLVEEGQALTKELDEKAIFMKHDVSKAKDWEKVAAETEAAFGPVTVLVNNAGIATTSPVIEMSEEHYRKVINVNQVFCLLRNEICRPIDEKTKNGSIINVSSLAGLVGAKDQVAYLASKFAVLHRRQR